MRLKDSSKLLLIVLAAITTRLFALWIGRAEFTGWLNGYSDAGLSGSRQ